MPYIRTAATGSARYRNTRNDDSIEFKRVSFVIIRYYFQTGDAQRYLLENAGGYRRQSSVFRNASLHVARASRLPTGLSFQQSMAFGFRSDATSKPVGYIHNFQLDSFRRVRSS